MDFTNKGASSSLNSKSVQNTLDDSLLDLFDNSIFQTPEHTSPKRKLNCELQPPQTAKLAALQKERMKNKLSLLKPQMKTYFFKKNEVDANGSQQQTFENDSGFTSTSTNGVGARNSGDTLLETDSDFFCTQVLKKLDKESMQLEETFQKKSDDLWNDHNLTTAAYQKEIDLIFARVEHTICELGPNEDNADVSLCDNAEWQALTDSIINMSTAEDANRSLSSAMRKALLENVAKLISPGTQINKTFVEIAPVFNPLGSFFGLPEKVKDLLQQYRGIDKLYGNHDYGQIK